MRTYVTGARRDAGRFRRLLELALAIAVSHGCAPLASLRPASALMAGRDNEIGLGAVTVSPRAFVDEPWLRSGQLWVSHRATSWLDLSAISAFDPEAATLGIGATALVIRADRFAAGVQGGLGYGWAEGGLPLSLRLFDKTWLYGTPRVTNIGIYPAMSLPVGLSLHVADAAFVRLEYQSSWQQFVAYNQRNHFAAALAVQW
jgi:hypothetical protein